MYPGGHWDVGRLTPEFPYDVKLHDALMHWGGIDVGIMSWWGVDSPEDKGLIDALMTPGLRLRYCPLYELEAYNPPTLEVLQRELATLYQAVRSRWYRIDGKPAMYIYNHHSPGGVAQEVVDRWTKANNGRFTLVWRVGPKNEAPAECVRRYAYEPTGYATYIKGHCISLSPGFHKVGEPEVLARNLDVWRWTVAIASQATEPTYITTWSEFPEATAICPSVEYGSAYLKALM